MGGSKIWDRVSGAEGPVSEAAQGVEPDAQALYGNACLFDLFGLLGCDDAEPEVEPLEARTGLAQAVDRAAARAELRDRFCTGDTPEEGKAWVSEEEFEAIAATYSDVRLGRTQLKLEGDEAFRAGAMGDIGRLLETESGRQLVTELAYNDRDRETVLRRAEDPDHPETSAHLDGLDPGTPEDRWALYYATVDPKRGGADSEVEYAPGHTVNTARDGAIPSDVTLYHELVHAWHNQQGDNATGQVDTGDALVPRIDRSELQAVGGGELNENRYRDERAIDLHEDLERRDTYYGVPVP